MEMALKEQLWHYIANHNPDLMYDLQEEYRVTEYLDERVGSIMAEVDELLDQGIPAVTVRDMYLEQLTEDLKPSRFMYIKQILEEEFPLTYEALQQTGMLHYELLNMLESCEKIFEKFGFSKENQDNEWLRYAVIGEIDFYLS